MPIEIDLVKYHRSIADEILSKKDRVRDLISDANWNEEGVYKEVVLRNIIMSFSPKNINVGTGFVFFNNSVSTQLDVLITDNNKPTLFSSGDHRIVTPDCVKAIIEVKTTQNNKTRLLETVNKLANEIESIRNFNNSFYSCWAGIFIYDLNNEKNISDKMDNLLECLNIASTGYKNRVINCVSFGPKLFARFWDDESNERWNVYNLSKEEYYGFSFTYFIGNLLNAICDSYSEKVNYAWFPIQDPNGKEKYRIKSRQFTHKPSNYNIR